MQICYSNSFLLDLPQEMILDILSFLDAFNLICVSQSCKILHSLAQICWKGLCARAFQIDDQLLREKRDENIDWKRYYFWKQTILNETLSWNTYNPLNVPCARMAHTSVPYGNSIIYINGQETQTKRFSDIHIYDTEKNVFIKPIVKGKVPSFARHTSVVIGSKVYTFGGFDGFQTFYDLAVFDIQTSEWNYPKVKGTPPIPRTNHTATVIGNKMYIYGGNYTPMPDGDYTVLGDLHVLDVTTMTWTEPHITGPTPGRRTAHTMKAIGTKIYLFGGGLWEPKPTNRWIAKYNDVFVLDTLKMHWTMLNAKMSVCSFPISFTIEHFIFFFGGQSANSEQLTNGLFYFDTVNHTINEAKSNSRPKPLDLGTASVIGNKAYIFAGSSGAPINDMVSLSFERSKPSLKSNQMDITF